jgi:hypothetical protein
MAIIVYFFEKKNSAKIFTPDLFRADCLLAHDRLKFKLGKKTGLLQLYINTSDLEKNKSGENKSAHEIKKNLPMCGNKKLHCRTKYINIDFGKSILS